MSDEWYYANKRNVLGPVSHEYLQDLAETGEIEPSTLIRRKGAAQWWAASEEESLFFGSRSVATATQAQRRTRKPPKSNFKATQSFDKESRSSADQRKSTLAKLLQSVKERPLQSAVAVIAVISVVAVVVVFRGQINADTNVGDSAAQQVSTASDEDIVTSARRQSAGSGRNRESVAVAPTDATRRAAAVNTDWPSWRGPNRDGISHEKGLLKEWPTDGPPLVWTARGLGGGMASVAVVGDVIYTMGGQRGTTIAAVGRKDGNLLWTANVGGGGSPNATPTVDTDTKLVYGISKGGDLLCANAANGREVWSKNFSGDFGGRMMSGWGYSESPLIDGDRLICTPGAQDAAIAALDKRTGRVIWKASVPGIGGSGYSSIVISQGAGVKQYVQLMGRAIIGVDAKDGTLLWQYNRVANGTANIPTPIVRGDYVFCSSGYNTGSALLKLERDGGGVRAEQVYFLAANKMQNHHGGMIRVGEYIYSGHGHNQGFPLCIELKTGESTWRRQRGAGSGSAAIAFADGHLYFRYENGTMALIEANPREYKLKSTFEIATRNGKSWPHPVISKGHLFLRDQDVLHCYNVKE